MSLSTTNPLFATCGSSPYETSKAVVQARFLSGRARVESLTKHWDMLNKEGTCSLCRHLNPTPGTIEHLLLSGGCPVLADTRLSLLSFFQAFLVSRSYLFPIFQDCWEVTDSLTMQFLLDCSVIPSVIQLSRVSSDPVLSDLFYMTRTFVFKIFVTRRRLITVN